MILYSKYKNNLFWDEAVIWKKQSPQTRGHSAAPLSGTPLNGLGGTWPQGLIQVLYNNSCYTDLDLRHLFLSFRSPPYPSPFPPLVPRKRVLSLNLLLELGLGITRCHDKAQLINMCLTFHLTYLNIDNNNCQIGTFPSLP